jgi:hypothetical protein
VRVTATSAIQLVGKNAEFFLSQDIGTGCGGGKHAESRASLPIAQEDWVYDPFIKEETRALFREASEAEAFRAIAELPLSRRS